ncbi:uncharacterized protein LOC105924301 isoform X2 [Fundulus heteroclitus]|uniref:uncharacterized protein LOC105924301 isoform X2 n=1 Tax=Fundulus heteroclitus TaxID=8078 RepID=UPI00079F8D72|nr:uncharacterized protein LOC105924301 isoform X2 [Fundulus heteroclitus]
MMEFVHVAVAVFSLLSLGQSDPVTNCDSLTKPFQVNGTDPFLGRWNYVAWSIDAPSDSLWKTVLRKSWLNIKAAPENDQLIASQYNEMFNRGLTLLANLTVQENRFSDKNGLVAGSLLTTGCPDCMLQYLNFTFGPRSYRSLDLLSRRTMVTDAELEEYKKQVQCLNLPPPSIRGSRKEIHFVRSTLD